MVGRRDCIAASDAHLQAARTGALLASGNRWIIRRQDELFGVCRLISFRRRQWPREPGVRHGNPLSSRREK